MGGLVGGEKMYGDIIVAVVVVSGVGGGVGSVLVLVVMVTMQQCDKYAERGVEVIDANSRERRQVGGWLEKNCFVWCCSCCCCWWWWLGWR